MSEHAAPAAHTDDHDALAVGWALHALDPGEETAFAVHLEHCPHCRRTVDETLELFGGIGGVADAVAPVDPPPALRQRLLDVVEDEASSPPVSPAAGEHDATVVPLAPRRRASRWLAVAAAAVVVALGGLAVADESLRSERDAAAAQAARHASVVDVLRDAGTPGVVHATLADPQGALVGMVVDDGTGPRVLATGLDPNTAEEIYVLWGLAGATPRPLGTFDVAGQMPAVRSVPSSSEAAPYAGFAISLEPGRVAPASPTRVIASGQVGR